MIATQTKKMSITNLFIFFLALLACIALKPYIVWNNKVIILVVELVTLALLFAMVLKERASTHVNKEGLVLGLLGLLVTCYFYRPGWTNGVPILGFISVLVSLACFLFLDKVNKIEVYKMFKFLFAIFMIPGLFIWLLYLFGLPWDTLIMGEISGEHVLNPLKGEAGLYYKEFPASVAIGAYMDGDLPFYRFSGMYDEPGVIGTIAGLFLLIERFNLSSWIHRILFMGGIVSFSLAFFGIIILYMLLTMNWKALLLMMLLILGVYFLLPMEIQSAIVEQVAGRLVMSSDSFQDNRETLGLVFYWDLWKNSSFLEKILGLNAIVTGDVGSSWKIIVIKQGVLGILILWIWLLFYTLKNYVGWISAVVTIVFAASFYQRPDILYLPQMIIFIGGLSYLKEVVQRTKGEGGI